MSGHSCRAPTARNCWACSADTARQQQAAGIDLLNELYIYAALADEGKVIKNKDRGWHPAGSALEPADRAAIEEKIGLEDNEIECKRARLNGVGPIEKAEIERDIEEREGTVQFWVNQIRSSAMNGAD